MLGYIGKAKAVIQTLNDIRKNQTVYTAQVSAHNRKTRAEILEQLSGSIVREAYRIVYNRAQNEYQLLKQD